MSDSGRTSRPRGTEVPRARDLRTCRTSPPAATLEAAHRSKTGPWGSGTCEGALEMRRRTFDALATAAGLLLAVVLLVAGGLLLWGHSFVNNEVHSQRAAQKIIFPPANSPAIKELPAADATAMKQFGGQLMTTGAQAQTYADHFIAVHLVKIGGGKTYSQLATASLAEPKN